MNPKKKKIILIVIIIAVVLLIIFTGIAYAYFSTDIFKRNKQAFTKYISDIGDKRIINYFEKVSNTPYENSGKFSVEIESDGLDEEKLEKINDFNISFSGKVDEQNSKSEQGISINYSDDVNFPINYKKTNDIFGIQTKYIGSKYLGVETDNLIEDFNKLGIISENTLTTPSSNLSEEDMEYIYQTYIPIILEKLTDDNFSKVEDNNQTGYKLTITTALVKDVVTSVLENLKNDTMILEKLNIQSKDIDSSIKSIQEIEESDQNSIEVIVYKENSKFKRLNIKINSNSAPVNLNIEKTQSNSDIQYLASIQLNPEQSNEIKFTVKYSGLDDIQTVQESYELGISGLMSTENSILSKAQVAKTETVIATEKEQINLLFKETEINKLMDQDSSSEISLKDLEDTINDISNNDDINIEETNGDNFKITFEETQDEFIVNSEGEIVEEPEEDESSQTEENTQNKDTFSYIYKYENQVAFKDSVDIENLSEDNTVILNKQKQDYVENLFNSIGKRLEEVNNKLMKEIDFSENENPILYLIPGLGQMILNQSGINQNQIDEMEVTTFNEKFVMYQSTNTKGATVKGLLSTIQANNETEGVRHKIEEINFDGQEYEVTEQNITLIKSEINVEDSYKVEFEKDEDTGLIFRVVINKK